MEWSWVRGFFEGDGHSSYSHGGQYVLGFTQKNPEILYKLKDFLQKGSIIKLNYGPYKYRITNKRDVYNFLKLINNANKDINYYIGLIEADGCFGSGKDGRFSFSICMYDEDIIKSFKEFFKVGNITTKINRWGKKCYDYRIKSFEECLSFCNILKTGNFISSFKQDQFKIFNEVVLCKFNNKGSVKPFYNYYTEKSKEMKKIKFIQYTEV